MCRRCCGCLAICCLSRKKRQSFPINEKQLNNEKYQQSEVNKIIIRPVESVRLPRQGAVNKKTKSKADDKELKCEINSSRSRASLPTLFSKYTPSPIPINIDDIPEVDHYKITVSTSSDWSSSTASDPKQHKKMLKHRSCTENDHLEKENTSKKKIISQHNDIKPAAKSKLILQNVRKMIKDQSMQEQHLNHAQQKESVRL